MRKKCHEYIKSPKPALREELTSMEQAWCDAQRSEDKDKDKDKKPAKP